MPGKDHRTRVTKMLIRRAFTDLLRVKPVQSISIKELCEKAGVNRGTFYAHYASVHDLLMQMEDEMLSEINEVLASLLPEDGGDVSSLRISTELFQCLKDNADLCTVTLGDFGDKSFAMRMLNMGWEKCFDAYSRYFPQRLSQGDRLLLRLRQRGLHRASAALVARGHDHQRRGHRRAGRKADASGRQRAGKSKDLTVFCATAHRSGRAFVLY